MVHGARSRRWSYAVHPHGAYEALYDLEADPGERHNLAGTFRGGEAAHAALREMRAQLEAWLASLGDTTALDDSGHLRLDPAAHGWEPAPPLRIGLGLRPY
jgi:arylsulfatase A-like enzyme